MTFTLVSHLREELSVLVRGRAEKTAKEETERERLAIEVIIAHFTVQQVRRLSIINDCIGRGGSNARHARNFGVIPSLERYFRQRAGSKESP